MALKAVLMPSESEKNSESPQNQRIFIEHWSERGKGIWRQFNQSLDGFRRDFGELFNHYFGIAGNLFCRFSLSLLSFVFTAAIGLFLASLMARTPSSSPVFFQGLLFGWTIFAAATIVYAARLLIWIRKSSITYWKKRTPPFEAKDGPNATGKESSSTVLSEVNISAIFWHHLGGALLANTLTFYSVVLIWSFTSFVEDVPLFKIILTAGKAIGLLYGGVIGLFMTGSSPPSSFTGVNEITIALLVFVVVIPSLPLTVAIRNFGHWLEVNVHDELWSHGIWGKVLIVVLDIVCVALLIESINFKEIPV